MVGTMAQVRAALGMAPSEIATPVPNLTCYPGTPDSVHEPCFYTGEVTIDRTKGVTFSTGRVGQPGYVRGQRAYEIQCTVLVSRGDDLAGQALLDRYLSEGDPWSIVDAIESDRTLGGMCHDLYVTGVDGYRLYTVAGKEYFGARLRVTVNA